LELGVGRFLLSTKKYLQAWNKDDDAENSELLFIPSAC